MTFSDEINTSNNFDKINYIDELILKLQLLYSKNIIKLPTNKLNLEEIVKKIKKTIQIILDRDENRFFRSTLTIEFDFNFEEKLNKCKKTYNLEFKDEIPFVIFDDTIFKTCQNGFIITNKNFY